MQRGRKLLILHWLIKGEKQSAYPILKGRKSFYAEDDTKGCTNQAQRFAELQPEFADKNAVIIGISKDTAESHKAFAEKYHLPFTILADPDKKVINMYGVWGEKKLYGKTVTGLIRTTYIIDEDGMIEKVFPNVRAAYNAGKMLKEI